MPTNNFGLHYVCKRWFQLISNLPRTVLVNKDNVKPFLACLERMQSTDTSSATTRNDQDWNLAKNVTYLLWLVKTTNQKKENTERMCRILHNNSTITHIKTSDSSISLFGKNDSLPKKLVHFAAETDDESKSIKSRLTALYRELVKCPFLVSIDIGRYNVAGHDPFGTESLLEKVFLTEKMKSKSTSPLTHFRYQGEIEHPDFISPLALCTALVSIKLDTTWNLISLSFVAKVLAANPNLTTLELPIEGGGYKVLYEAIFAHPSLRSLCINFDSYKTKQDHVDSFIDMFQKKKNTKISDIGFKAADHTIHLLDAFLADQVVSHLQIDMWNAEIQSSIVKSMKAGSSPLKCVSINYQGDDPIKGLLEDPNNKEQGTTPIEGHINMVSPSLDKYTSHATYQLTCNSGTVGDNDRYVTIIVLPKVSHYLFIDYP
ncbi:hypothetical protein DFA_01298 [Cavenderia fasciculata]|uniref:F-box domain-containing protein n=1 Tax=Cavenderia fasciculata TaxID=261658 RepID=F4PRX8_CACFS|nr:uncharacterized protein DFA_01298 [Cavenderia fasciculata]EGG21414.1 hypothetical protein DFA_01298 [Cavenderia fasciculata]|eukprot:XP_004359264.1 hypothetical protein DFA_01298 [Cavenderia fasciculata]